MTHDEFIKLLKLANLNKKEFVAITKLAYSTVVNWNGTDNVPHWVKSWLENYMKSKSYDEMKKSFFIEELLSRTDSAYIEEAIYIYKENKNLDKTIKIINIASSLHVDAGQIKGLPNVAIFLLYEYLEEIDFKATLADRNNLIGYINDPEVKNGTKNPNKIGTI